MKICLFNNLYKPFNRGGAEKITESLAEGLKRAGHEVFIITTRPWFKSGAAAGGMKIYRLKSLYSHLKSFPKAFRFFWHLWDLFNLVNYFKIKRILKQENCRLAITNNLMGLGLLTPRALKKLKIKQVHLAHDIQLIHPSGLVYWGKEDLIDSLPARNYAGLCSRLFDSPDIVIFPSLWLRDLHLAKIFFVKSRRLILPNPIEAAPYQPGEKTAAGFKFLFLGQIEEHKGVFLLLEAFQKLAREHDGLELLFVGSGSRLADLKKLAGSGPVKFLDWPDEAEVNRLLKESDLLVYPSLCYENCPNAIQRAFAAGLPVLAADLGGISELLSRNAGLLFKPGDAADLAAKMAWALNNPEALKALAEAGKEKAALSQADSYIKELLSLI